MLRKAEPKERFSIIKKLREENKSNDLFEIMLSNITFEEMIALKLELIHKAVGNNLYGIKLYNAIKYITKDAVLRYALAVCQSKSKAVQFLGIDKRVFYEELDNYGLRDYYNDPSRGHITDELNNRRETEKDIS